jgi:hypothetical protein
MCIVATGLVELSVAGLPLEDADLAALLRAFPRLRVLDISGCQKLSPAAADILLHGGRLPPADSSTGSASQPAPMDALGGGDVSPQPLGRQQQQQQPAPETAPLPAAKLQVVDMQRCFQLEAHALTSVLAALHTSSLASVLTSHLTMDSWPPGSAPHAGVATESSASGIRTAPADHRRQRHRPPAAAQYPTGSSQPLQLTPKRGEHAGAGLRVLALHNCVMLTPIGLQVIHLLEHPLRQYRMLGD